MAKINTTNYQPVTAWDGTQDLFVVEQPDGTKVATPEQVKQYVLNDMDEVPTQDSNKLVKSGGVFSAIDDSVSLKSATGNPITLTDAANANAESLSMTIEPIQSGSGDPSPDNVRPISGLTEGLVTRTRKNLLPMTVESIKQKISNQYPSQTWVGDSITFFGITHTILHDGDIVTGIKVNGTNISGGYRVNFATFTSPDTNTYILNGTPAGLNGKALLYDNVGAWDTGSGASYNWERNHVAEIYFYLAGNTSFNNVVFTPMIRFATETDPTFEPYTANTATITFGQTVYGGSVDFKTGQVRVTHANIASYNGESINEPWLSSLDKYESGATPTTGAQVVYPLSTPTTLTLTPAELELLKGNNTITANGAEISIEYYPDNAIGALAKRVDALEEILSLYST